MAKPEKHVFVCIQSRPPGHPKGSCADHGCQKVLDEFQQQFEQRELWGKMLLTKASCMGTCEYGPSVLVYPESVMYGKVTQKDVTAIVEEHLLGGTPVDRLRVPEEAWG
ncbi:MAG: (2Fe-2S) ferredoxin domain-containing protein [Gammaproteobacteria bacterium]|nr:(2Fe-2S) ferredoxin domain-containing protein [Gammaproteobacteria bacterium]